MGHQTCAHNRYRIDCTEFEALWARASGCCEICGIAETEAGGGKLHIDHDNRIRGHWAVRGILCSKCNSLMRYVDRGRKISERAERYERNAWYKSNPPSYYYPPHPLAPDSAWKALARYQPGSAHRRAR